MPSKIRNETAKGQGERHEPGIWNPDKSSKARTRHDILGWRDILIDAKKIFRVVLPLHLREALVVYTVSIAHTLALIGGKEIDIHTATGEGGCGIEVVATTRCTVCRRLGPPIGRGRS